MKSATRTIHGNRNVISNRHCFRAYTLRVNPCAHLGRESNNNAYTCYWRYSEGPMVGMFVGLIFGMISFITAASPLLKTPS